MNQDTFKILHYEKILKLVSEYTTSSAGKIISLQTTPSTGFEDINRWLRETSEMVSLIRSNTTVPLGGVHHIEPLFEHVVGRKSPLEPDLLIEILDTLRASETVREFCQSLGPEYDHVAMIGTRIQDHSEFCGKITRCIGDHGTIKDDASPRLARIRTDIYNLKKRMETTINSLIQSRDISLYLQVPEISIRNNRFVIPVKSQFQNKVPGVHHGRSLSGATIYIEPQQLVEPGNELETLIFQEQSEISKILWELTKQFLDEKDSICTTLEQLAWLDYTYAKAKYSIDYSMSEPVINSEGKTDLVNARHPILLQISRSHEDSNTELKTSKTVVPIDVRLGSDFHTLIITGPNTGGKTVTLKTLGLFSLMAQSGMHIPADPGSTLPVYKNVFADIGDEQSLEQSLSTFSSHVQRIISILKKCDSDTLVLLDELGAGTDPVEGAALGSAILEYLHNKQTKTVVTTHLGQLKMFAYLSTGAENACVEFNPNTLKPTFRLLIGQPGRSNALIIGEKLGIPKEVLQRAKNMMENKTSSIDDTIDKIQQTRFQVEENLRIAKSRLKEATEKKLLYDKKYEETCFKENQLKREMEMELLRIINMLKQEFLNLLTGLVKNKLDTNKFQQKLVDRFQEIVTNTNLGKKRETFLKKLDVGDTVFLNRFNEVGTVKSIDKKKRVVTVKVLDKKLKTSFDEISWVDLTLGWR